MLKDVIPDILQRLEGLSKSGDLSRFSRETGVNYAWLKLLLNDRIQNPGIKSLDKLQEALDEWDKAD